MSKRIIVILWAVTACMMAAGCGNAASDVPHRGVYYWKTTFRLNDYERKFLKDHSVDRIYLRLFDVVGYGETGRPEATIRFEDTVPEGVEVVPVVYIENKVLADFASIDQKTALASRILERVDRMMRGSHIAYSELQLDCDWGITTQDDYYYLCQIVRNRLHREGRTLSSTVRLWQANGRSDSLPADNKVLMLYNTGSIPSFSTRNSIFDARTIESYLGNLRAMEGRVDVALPAFGWGVLFSDWESYQGLIHETDYSDTLLYRLRDDGLYDVLVEHDVDGQHLSPDYVVRREVSEADAVRDVMRKFPSHARGNTTILYHLDSLTLSRYTYDEIEAYFDR